MKKYFDKNLSTFLLITNLLVFLLYSIVMPHVTLVYEWLNILLFLILLAPLGVLGGFLIKKNWREPKGESFYYDRAFNLLSFVNTFFFSFSLSSVINLTKTIRAAGAILYITFFALVFLFNIFEVLYRLGLFNTLFKDKKITAPVKDLTKELAADAKRKRIDEVMSTRRFFIIFTTVIAILFFIYPLVSQNFTVPLGGDYTQQQIPFYTNGYDDWWHFLKTGEFPLWDHNTFLGANNVGSNSFYYAFNPFFLPILLVPRALIPQGLALLMIGKFVLAAVTMRLYLKYMGVEEKNARFFALIFAFSGWNVYYLWFNHFMEVAVIFPLIFLGIEKVLKEKKIRLLIFSLALMGFSNFFFLMTVLVVAFFYALIRYCQLLPKIDPTVLGLGVLAFVLGTLMSAVVLLPSLAISLDSDRATNATYLDSIIAALKADNLQRAWDIITKWDYADEWYSHKAYYPLISYYFPVLSNRSVALLNTSSYDNTISSLFSFSPVILLFFPSVYVSAKNKKISHLLIIALFLFAIFTPFAYNLLHGFTKEYGRWQLIATFSLITYVAISLPAVKKEKAFIFDLSLLINVILMAITVKIAFSYENKNGFSYMYEREYIIFYQAATLFATYLLYRLGRENKNFPYFKQALLVFEIAVMGTVTMIGHGIISYTQAVNGGLQSYNDDLLAIRKIQSLDDSFYRIYNTSARHGHHNLPMRENYNGVSAFHSLYNFELMNFNRWSRINASSATGWSLGVYERRSLLYDFLQIKYYVLNDNDSAINWSNGTKTVAPYQNIPNTYSFEDELSTSNRFVYKVRETFDIGFGVDYAISYETVALDGSYLDRIALQGNNASVQNEELYLQTALLSYTDHQKVTYEYPHLGTKTYESFPHYSYSRFAADLSNLNVKYYSFLNQNESYPYTAQLRSDGKKPTPTWVEDYGTELLGGNIPAFLDGNKHVIEYTARHGGNLLDGPGEIIIDLPMSYVDKGLRYRVFLYDEDYNVITWDDHNSLPSYGNSWKVMRSFHSPTSVVKMALIPMGERNIPPRRNVYVYKQETIDAIRQSSIDNSLQNVVTTTNKITFSTNYENEKFVVTTIPYDTGWSVTTTEKVERPVYKVQGGFVGFISEKGETDYIMSFTPEYFNIGLLLSFSALVITLLLELNFYFYRQHQKKKKELT